MGRKIDHDSIRRRRPRLSPRSRILIVCEGKVTEPTYFKELGRQERARLIEVVVNDEGGVPKTLVERAALLKKSAQREARRQKDDFLRYDEVWCVFDIDAHPNVPDAVCQAKANGIFLAISNPCFELWILLHFQDQRAHVDRHQVQASCRHHIPGYGKIAPVHLLSAKYAEAVARASALHKWQREQGRAGENPSTAVHLLTERVRELGNETGLLRLRDLIK